MHLCQSALQIINPSQGIIVSRVDPPELWWVNHTFSLTVVCSCLGHGLDFKLFEDLIQPHVKCESLLVTLITYPRAQLWQFTSEIQDVLWHCGYSAWTNEWLHGTRTTSLHSDTLEMSLRIADCQRGISCVSRWHTDSVYWAVDANIVSDQYIFNSFSIPPPMCPVCLLACSLIMPSILTTVLGVNADQWQVDHVTHNLTGS